MMFSVVASTAASTSAANDSQHLQNHHQRNLNHYNNLAVIDPASGGFSLQQWAATGLGGCGTAGGQQQQSFDHLFAAGPTAAATTLGRENGGEDEADGGVGVMS